MKGLEKLSGVILIAEVWGRVLIKASELGVEPPPVKDEVLRLLTESDLSWIRGEKAPDWLSEDIDTFLLHTTQFCEQHGH